MRPGCQRCQAGRTSRAAEEHVGQHARDLPGVAVFDPIDVDRGARSVGAVEPPDPGRSSSQHFRPLGDHHDGVETGDRLELDHVLAKAVLAGIDDLLQLRDDRRRRTARDRENSDRLPAHPVDIEAERRIDRGAALGAAALDQEQVARGIGAHAAGFGGETVHQLEQGLRRHIL